VAEEDEGRQQPEEAGSHEPVADSTADRGAEKPVVPAPPPKKPASGAKPRGPQKEPWTDPLIEALEKTLPDQRVDSYTFLGLRHLVVRRERVTEVLRFLRSNPVEAFDFLSDETATHWPDDEEFEIVYVLFSFQTHNRVIVKTRVKEWESLDSATSVWPGADWLEREIYDMFGIRFEGHPNLKRILLPEDWVGFPLRKDYDIRLQDVEWVRKHLGIESGQKFYVGKAKHEDD